MIKKIVILTLLLSSAISTFAQEKNHTCKQTPLLISMLTKFHLTPIELNPATSEQIFNDFIKELDPSNSIFTSQDITSFSAYKTQLLSTSSDEVVCGFIQSVTDIFLKRYKKADSLITSILNKPLNFDSKDSITFHPDYIADFLPNDKELEKRWIRKLKYQALDILFTPVGDSDPMVMDAQHLMLKEAEIRKKLALRETRTYQRILDYPSGPEAYITEIFLNTIANRYDPHTLYFSPSKKEEFLASLSKEAKAFGFTVAENKSGEVEIGYMVPGGPAWKSNQLNNGDLLLQVKWPKGEVLDLTYSTAGEVDNIIRNSTYDEMLLTVKKANGTTTNVPLVKEIINVEENSITGYVLKGDKKVGYISLPGFYTDMGNQDGLGCANDVAKEILKLQKENIDGLILDLRNNRGGSLLEAIGLTGLFIDEGPLFIEKPKDQKPILLKDMNRGRVYSGPLIVMVNGFSASASELVTAGLRDYNRALIAGSTTFGKAIVQVTLPLDTNLVLTKKPPENASPAFVNVTVAKLYRLNGESHQKIGIPPDIELPDMYSGFKFSEATMPYAISSDKIDKKVYFNPLPAIPMAELAQKSKERMEKKGSFNRIYTLSDSLQHAMKKGEVLPLNIESFREYRKRFAKFEGNMDQLLKIPSKDYIVLPSGYNESLLQADSHRKETNDIVLKKILEDIYIEEVYNEMKDLINVIK